MKSSALVDNVERGPLGLLPDEEEWVKDKMEYALHDFEVLSLAIKRYKWQLSQVPKDISRLQSLKEKHAQDPFEFLRQIRSKEFRYPEGQRTLPAPTVEWSKYHYPPANPVTPTKPQHATYLGTGFFPSTNEHNNNNVVAISSTNSRPRAGSPSYERLRTVKEAARNLGIHTSRHHHQVSGQDVLKENGRSQTEDAVEIRNSRPSTPETGKWNRAYSKSPGVVARLQDMEGVTYSTQPDTLLSAPAPATPESIPAEALPQQAPVLSDQNPPFLHQSNSNNNITYNHMNGSIDIQPGKTKAYSREGSGVRDDPKPLLYNIPWSDEEQKLLERLLDEYPDEPVAAQRFQKISLAMGTRTPKQVASRVQKYFIKLVKAGLEAPGRMNYSLEPAKPKVKGASPNAKTKKRKEAPAAGEGSTSKGKAVARGKKKEDGAVKKQKPKSGGVGRISGAQYLHYSAAPSVYMSEDDDEDSVQDMIAVSTSTPGSDGGIASHFGFAASSKGAAQQQPVPALILKPFINFKALANPETASATALNIQHRKLPNSINVAAINELHKTVAEMSQKLDMARSERNRVAAEMKDLFGGNPGGKGKKKKQGDQEQQPSMSPQDKEQKRKELVERGKVLKEEIHAQETELSALESKLYEQAVMIPNSTHPTSPIGPESAAQLIRIQGVPRLNAGVKAFAHPGSEESTTGGEQGRALLGNESSYPLLDHVSLSKILDLVDFEAATAVTGSRWYYLKNEAALLELALIQFATQRAVRKGFTPVITPDVVRPEVVQACGFQPRDEASQTYWVSTTAPGSTSKEAAHHHQHSALCLVATAEIALAGMNMNRVLEESLLPIKLAGFGRAFRAEAGSRGAEVKGLYRVHQFSKVELFVVSKADQVESDKALEEIRQFQEDIFEELGLCYRVLDMPTEELGASAYKKYDIEAWMPGRNGWGEISSTSNCTDYQARRLNIRYRTNKIRPQVSSGSISEGGSNSYMTTEFAHTLNGTAMAIPRIIVALLETYQQKDGSVHLPECLWPFMAGVQVIRPKDHNPSSILRSAVTTTPIVFQRQVDASAATEKKQSAPFDASSVIWSPALATSTRTTKSILQLNRLAGENLSWPEIASSIGIYIGDCKSQWIRMYDELEHLQPVVTDGFDHNALKTAVLYPGSFERFWLRTPQKTALVQANDFDWDKIALELFDGKFSPAFIRHTYINYARPLHPTAISPHGKQQLVDYMDSLGYTLNSDNPLPKEEPDWRYISEYLFGGFQGPSECRRVWHMFLNRRRKHVEQRKWTQDRVIQYWKTWLKVGKNWQQIANSLKDTDTGSQNVPPPTVAECRKEFTEISLRIAQDRPDLYQEASAADLATGVVNRSRRDNDWTDEMHQELVRVVKEEEEAYRKKNPEALRPKVGWETVAKRLDQPGLTAVRCKKRYNRMHRAKIHISESHMPRLRIMKEDMAQLLDAVNERHPVKYKHWQQLRTDIFPNHSVYSLQQMWYNHAMQEMCQSPVLKNRLEKAVLDNGEHAWGLVSEDMSKDGAAYMSMRVCREVWQTQVADKSNPSWTEQETHELQECAKRLMEDKQRAKESDILEALDWIKIRKEFSTKTSIQCREKWEELGLLRQQELLREKMREMDPAFIFIPTINVEKVAEGFWSKDKGLFNKDSDTKTTVSAKTKKSASVTQAATARGIGPSALTLEELNKVWRKHRWTPERAMVAKKWFDRYGRHPSVQTQVGEKLGASPSSCTLTYHRLVQSPKRKQRSDKDEVIESTMKSPSSRKTNTSFLWSKEYDLFLASRMALVGEKYKSRKEAFVDVANVFDVSVESVSGRWRYILRRLAEEEGKERNRDRR
ncbi:seryl-tRNA synthetase [Podila verticillata]|nr:seryl-tRNA synthetase [Podila verticillata]